MERHEIPIARAKHRSNIDGTRSVSIRLSTPAASTVAGQVFAWTLINLIARAKGVCSTIHLDVPDVPTLGPHVVPFSNQALLPDALLEGGNKVAQGCQVVLGIPTASDVAIAFGQVDPGLGPRRIWALGGRWVGAIASNQDRLPDLDGRDPNPIGPAVAACLCAAEVFKETWFLVDEQDYQVDHAFNAHSIVAAPLPSTRSLLESPPWTRASLGDIYVIGAGAVGQAGVHVILHFGTNLTGTCIIVDQPSNLLDSTNLSRYTLSCIDDINIGDKADIVESRARNRCGVTVIGRNEGWQALVHARGRANRADFPTTLAAAEAKGAFVDVWSCVDTNSARHLVQDVLPLRLIQGSTFEFGAQVRRFDLSSTTNACARCFAPAEPPRPDADLVAELSGLTQTERRARAQEKGVDPNDLERWLETKCLGLSAEALSKFRDVAAAPEASISFVSYMAGIMLVADHLRQRTGDRPDGRSRKSVYNFLSGNAMTEASRAQQSCMCQTAAYSAAHRAFWAKGKSP